MPRLRAMPSSKSPVTAVSMKESVAAIRMSPLPAACTAPNSARLSAGPAWQVTATPTITVSLGASGLMR
jgi:hypothetical protein